MRDIVITYEGEDYIHESVHRERLIQDHPEALSWCNMVSGSITVSRPIDGEVVIQFRQAGKYRYWAVLK